jgi:hypothetical protein
MTENNRNQQDQASGTSTQQNQDYNQGNQQNKAGQSDPNQNPQSGDQWNNYRTREMSDQGSRAGNASTPKEQ